MQLILLLHYNAASGVLKKTEFNKSYLYIESGSINVIFMSFSEVMK